VGEMHTVQQGECLSSIAVNYNIPWKKIYNHPQNSEFRRKRPDPNVIFAGDQLYIPDLQLRTEDAATDQNHVFVVSTPKTKISLVVQDEMGRPLANMKYILKISGGSSKDLRYTGTTTGEGQIEQGIPSDATNGELRVLAAGAGYSWALALGYLDPMDEISGVQHRLHNLGYDTDSASPGELDDATRAALEAFQYDVNLPVTGDLDDKTKSKLKELHD
jgi:hypothetical protein